MVLAAPPPKMPRATGFVIGTLLLIAGIAAGIVVIVLSFGEIFEFPRTIARGAPTTFVAEAGQHFSVYRTGTNLPGGTPDCEVTTPTGETVQLGGLSPLATPVTINSVVYTPAASYTAAAAGTHSITCGEGAFTSGALAIGPEIAVATIFGTVGGVFLGIGLIFLGVVAGIVLIVVTAVRRSSARRRLQQYPGVWPGPYPG